MADTRRESRSPAIVTNYAVSSTLTVMPEGLQKPTVTTPEYISQRQRLFQPLLEKCESPSSSKPEQKMWDIQIPASIYAIIFGIITMAAWTTSNGFSNQANCLAKTANKLSLAQLLRPLV